MKTVLITGSSKGLGESLALIFSKNNYNVILHGRNKDDLGMVKSKVLKNNVSCDVVVGDTRDKKTIEELAKIADEKDISIFINNAAIMSKDFVEEIKDEEIDEVINVDLSCIIKLTTRIYKFFLKKQSGIIININSTAGIKPAEKHALYSAAKYGLKGFSDSLRIEAKPNNIMVLDIHPGGMKTTFHDRAGGHKNKNKSMNTDEVAEIIFNLVGYESVHVDEITLTRVK